MKPERALFFIVYLLAATVAFANGGESHGAHGLDPQRLTLQSINFLILVAGLIYVLRRPLKQYIEDKRKAFIETAEKAQAARSEAEKEHLEIKIRLQKLESTSDESISRARAEAVDMRNQLIAEARDLSKKIREEAESAARLEVEKARSRLREQLIEDSIKVARSKMGTVVGPEDHKRLQGDFINNMQAVQQ